ncbi:hypothetical protein IJI99_00655 [bacterium]|nr:hypothetical protein [bacterium]
MMSATLSCPHGKVIAGKHVKCFNCPTDSTYDSINVTCTSNDSNQVYDIDTGTCNVCGIGYANGGNNSCVIDTTNYSTTLDTYYDAANCSDPVGWMDQWTGCSSLATVINNESITDEELAAKTVCLLDPRDHRSYRVRRFDDDGTEGQSSGDKCWTIDSLRFGGNYGEIDGCSANNGEGNFTYAWCGGSGTSGCTAGGSGNATQAQETFATGYYGHCRAITAADSRDGNAYNNYLYDWVAAMQSTLAYYGSSTTFSGTQQGLCPQGWHIPSSTSSGEYTALGSRYGINSSAVTNFWTNSTKWAGASSGNAGYSSGVLFNQGGLGSYWSSSAYSSSDVCTLLFYSSIVDPSTNSNKHNGQAVRCIKD